MWRSIENQINRWLSDGEGNALLIDGARQVGKTYTIRQCLQNFGRDYLEINLIENTDALSAIAISKTVGDLTVNLSAVTGHYFKKNETIIFIDEVQELSEIVTMIKFWVDEGSYRYILSGSLLGVELKALRSAPVGYLREIKMFPMNFKEFMTASGITEDVQTHLGDCFINKIPVGEIVHEKIMQLFHRYLVVGGMPQAVFEYVETGNMGRVGEIQSDIISLYKRDFTKYETENNKLVITNVYDTVPAQLLKLNRRFNYADIRKGLRFERIESSFLWLYRAGVVLHAFNTTEPKIPLKINEKSSLVKLYYSDVGLLTHSYGETVRRNLLFGIAGANLGGIYENAVIQELCSQSFNIYYYNSKKMGELDFVTEYKGKVLPIEVKSGKDYYVHSAINNVIANREFEIDNAVVFTGYDINVSGKITYYPVYMAGFFSDIYEDPIILEPVRF